MPRTFARTVLFGVLLLSSAPAFARESPFGMSALYFPLTYHSMPREYVGDDRINPQSGYGAGFYSQVSAIDLVSEGSTSKFRFGDLLGAGFGIGSGDPVWLNLRIEVGVQVAWQVVDLVDVGLKVYGLVNLDRLSYIGLVVKPHVRVGPVLASVGFGSAKDPEKAWRNGELRYIWDLSNDGGWFAGVDVVQTIGTNKVPVDGNATTTLTEGSLVAGRYL